TISISGHFMNVNRASHSGTADLRLRTSGHPSSVAAHLIQRNMRADVLMFSGEPFLPGFAKTHSKPYATISSFRRPEAHASFERNQLCWSDLKKLSARRSGNQHNK